MFYFKRFGNSKGQALVEAALTAPLIVFFLFMIIWFARIMLTWQQITGAARYGTDMIAYTSFSKEDIGKYITNYLCDKGNIGRTLDSSTATLHIDVNIHDQPPHDYSLSLIKNIKNFNPVGLADTVKNILPVVQNSSVTITYTYKTPPVMHIVGIPELNIKAYSEVLSGTGSAGQKKRSGT